jgi:hypothetical protein
LLVVSRGGREGVRVARRLGAASVFVACVSFASASAVAAIVAQDARLTARSHITTAGVGRIKIGMTVSEARRRSGSNIVVHTVNPGCESGSASPKRLGVGVLSRNFRIAVLYVTKRGIATKSGVRVRDSVSRLLQVYRGRLVKRPEFYNPQYYNYELRDGNRKVIFSTDNKKVTMITTGRKPEVDYVEGCL